MNPEERNKLAADLRAISSALVRLETQNAERREYVTQRFRAIDARLGKLEASASESGRHDLAVVTKALDKKTEQLDKLKWWALSIVAALITSAITGLVVHYFTKG